MVGYIVGYYEDWASDLNPMIIGYYTTWDNAIVQVKRMERINIDQYKQLYKVYLVEIEPDKTYTDNTGHLWAENFDHYIVKTNYNKTFLYHNKKAITISLELPPPISQEPSQNKETVDAEWKDVHNRRIPKKVKKITHQPRKKNVNHK